ncbi:large ribosomal subunit protein uL13m isoform X7 [Ovis canadensis]|uniref:large ribosomal subunit protein uL13m isoform X7 n=1 Tax=Ovis canadensis TaxID=37174 RepID=UPI00375275DB
MRGGPGPWRKRGAAAREHGESVQGAAGGLPNPGIEPYLLRWQARSLLLSYRGSPGGGMRREIWRKDNALQEFTARKREEMRQPSQWATFARVWYLLDGKMQPPGKLAALASVRLQGLHKPVYHQLSDCGDHVVIMNTRHIAFSGNKWEQKVYSSHTGYPGGFKQVTAAQLHRKDPVAT